MNSRRLWVAIPLILTLILVLGCGQTPAPTKPPTTPASTSPPAASVAPPPRPSPTSPASPTASSQVSFAGRTITVIVPYAPGGGGDITARLYAKFLPKFLPGNPNMIVRNMPGGNATIGANFAYNARPDGLTLMASSASAVLNYVIGMAAVKYDLRKMDPIVGLVSGGVYTAKAGLISKVEDLPKATKLKFGSTAGSMSWIFITCIDLLGLRPEKVIPAYASGGEALRAFLSGETNVVGQSGPEYWTGTNPYVERGEAQWLFQTGVFEKTGNLIKDPAMPPALTVKEVYEKLNNGKAPSGVAWDAFSAILAAGRSYDKILWLPPGAPANVISTYREAAVKMLKDPEFIKAGAAASGDVIWLAGGDFADDLKNKLAMQPRTLEWLKERLEKYNIVID